MEGSGWERRQKSAPILSQILFDPSRQLTKIGYKNFYDIN